MTTSNAKASRTAKAPEVTSVLRHPPYTYLHLAVTAITPHNQLQTTQQLDEVTARSYLSSALQQYLGLTGSAIPIDILKVEGMSIWIRVPHEDCNAVVAAISQWSSPGKGLSLRIEGRGTWLGALVAKGRGEERKRLWSLES